MGMTAAVKALVDALTTDPASTESSQVNHASHHDVIHTALIELYALKRYKAYYTQTSTSAPISTAAAENAFGYTVTPSYVETGHYRFTFSSAIYTDSYKLRAAAENAYSAAARIVSAILVNTTTVDVYAWDADGAAVDVNAFWLLVEHCG